MNIKTSFNFTFISILLIVILGFSLYYNSLSNGFIWDDFQQIVERGTIESWSNIDKVFDPSVGRQFGPHSVSYKYRPMDNIANMLDYSLWKLNPVGYHLTNIILHITVSLLIYWLVILLCKNKIVALFTSILFITHPVHTGAVAYIAGRADALVSIFILGGVIAYIKQYKVKIPKKKIIFDILIILFFTAALFSRENALIFPFILLIYNFCFKKKPNKVLLIVLLLMGIGYIFFRIEISYRFLTGGIPPLVVRIPGFFVAFITYLKLLFFPVDLHNLGYGKKLFRYTNPVAISGAIVFFILIVYAFKSRTRDKLISFSLLWFFINLIPFSNIVSLLPVYMAEHWLYLPSIGFFLLLGVFLSLGLKKEKIKKSIIMLIIIVISFYSILTVKYSLLWGHPFCLYRRILKYNPTSWKAYYNLAFRYYWVGKYQEAISVAKRGIEITNMPKLYKIVGASYFQIHNYEKSIYYYKKTIKKIPDNAGLYYKLSLSYYSNDQKEKAAKYLNKAIELGYEKPKPIILKSLEPYMK